MRKYRFHTRIAAAALVIGIVTQSNAQQGLYAFPLKNQSPEQQSNDQNRCGNWATKNTGYDPRRTQAQGSSGYYGSAPPPQAGYFGKGKAGQGGVVRDSAGGAALGAIGGAIAGDAGKGAAIGALAGGLFGGIRRSNRNYEREQYYRQQEMQRQEMQRQQQATVARDANEYRRAWTVCMQGLGYNVD